MKRLLVLALALILTLSCASFAAAEERPVISYWAALENSTIINSNAEKYCYQACSEATGVDIEWIHPPVGQEDEQFSLLVVSDELPDIIEYKWNEKFPGGAEAAIANNVIIPLNDLLEEYAPNYWNYLKEHPEVEQMVMTDSGIHYVIPYLYTITPEDSETWQSLNGRELFYETYCGLIIRQDWLEDLGLDVPVTVDDWYNVLVAFKNEKGAIAPLSVTWDYLKQAHSFATAYGVCLGYYQRDGKVLYGPYEPAYKDFLTTMNKFYTEGLLDTDFAVIDQPTMAAKAMTGQAGAWIGYASTSLGSLYSQMKGADPESRFYPIGVSNPKATEDQVLEYRQASYPYWNRGAAISSSCEDVESALKYLDWAFSEEGDKIMNWGKEGESFNMVDGWPELGEICTNDPDGHTSSEILFKYNKNDGCFAMDHLTRLRYKVSATPESLNCLDAWAASGAAPAELPPVTLLAEESADYAAIFSEVDTYVSEMTLRFIMGSEPLENFDEYINTLKDMGVEEMIATQQRALDRYNAR